MCCLAVSQLLILGNSILSNAKKDQDTDTNEDVVNIDWPEDSVEKAKVIKTKAQSMAGSMEAVSISFITGMHVSDFLIDCYILIFLNYTFFGPQVIEIKALLLLLIHFLVNLACMNISLSVSKLMSIFSFAQKSRKWRHKHLSSISGTCL